MKRSWIEQTPFIPLVLALIAGILLHSYIHIVIIPIAVALIGVAAIVFSWVNHRLPLRHKRLFGLGILLVFVGVGWMRSEWQLSSTSVVSDVNASVSLVEVSSQPRKTKSQIAFDAKLLRRDVTGSPYDGNGKVRVTIWSNRLNDTIRVGDRLMIYGTIRACVPSGNPDCFDYSTYLLQRGIGAQIAVSDKNFSVISRQEEFNLRNSAIEIREQIVRYYERMGLKDDNRALLEGVTLGVKDDLSLQQKQAFSGAGAMHVLAVSGLHVGVLFLIVSGVLSWMRRRRWLSYLYFLIMLLLLWSYALITGMSWSVVRAVIMITIWIIGKMLKRDTSLIHTLFITAFIILLLDPNSIFQLSFQLSFAAMIGILLFTPYLERIYEPKHRIGRYLMGIVYVSVAAQLGTALICAFYFMQLPSYFLLTNLLILPLLSFLLYVLLFAVAIQAVCGDIALLDRGVDCLLNLFNRIVGYIASLPGAQIHLSVEWWHVLGVNLLVVVLLRYYTTKQYKLLVVASVVFVGIVVIDATYFLQSQQERGIIVYQNRNALAVELVSNKKSLVVTNSSEQAQKLIEKRIQKHRNKEFEIIEPQTWREGCFWHAGKSIMFLYDYPFKGVSSNTPIEVDLLVISKNIYPRKELFANYVSPRIVVMGTQNAPEADRQFEELSAAFGFEYHSVFASGAYQQIY